MKNMREQILKGNRVLENGTYVELQPSVVERNQGARWFAVIRDSRVMSGQLLMNYCETNCQALQHGEIARVYVESILRVGPGPHIPFSDVPTSTPKSSSERPKLQSASRHTGNGRKQECDTDCSPLKRQRDSGLKPTPPKEQRVGTAPADNVESIIRVSAGQGRLFEDVPHVAATSAPHTPTKNQGSFSPLKLPQSNPAAATPKAPSVAGASSTGKRPRQHVIVEETSQSPLTRSPQPSAITPSQHEKEMQEIETGIERATRNNVEALNQFRAASKKLTDAGWKRCKTVEQRVACSNIEHPDYHVVEIPRDGKCAYHCLLRILEAEHFIQPPATPQELRQVLATYARQQAPPPEYDKGQHGGIWANAEYLPLEEPLESTYGGEAALAVFVQVYDVTIHCHAPESRDAIQTFKGSSPGARGYHMLQTYSWKSWQVVEKKDPKTNVIAKTYKHHYGGDHWQLLEPRDRPQALKKLNFQSLLQSAASAASTAPKSFLVPDAVSQRQDLEPKRLTFGASAQSGEAAALPSFTLCAATEVKYPPCVHFMLREVSGRKTFVRNPIFTSDTNSPRFVTVKGTHFLEDYFGDTFRLVYPSSVQQLLYAFPDLDESNRSFFMSLGIGADLDPYTLQNTFRSHALRLPKNSVDQSVIQTLQPGFVVNWRVLQWCWPAQLDAFRIHVLESGNMFVFESPGSHKKHDMILRFENQRYTLLHAMEGATAEQSMQNIPRRQLTLNKMVQCQDMRTFDEFCDANFFLSAALEGSEPNEHELDSMWKEAVDAAGLQYEENSEKWLTFPAGLPPATLANVDGSLRGTSWKQLQQALLSALESDAASCEATLRSRTMRSPPRAALSNPRPNLGDVTFMDAGSESGKGLYRMMSDKRITHVAGVELQHAWYTASCDIMTYLRKLFKAKNFRMPAVTIVRSCMAADIPELTYLYSIARIMWMNNYVFHKVEYFAAKRNSAAPLPLIKGCRDLTTNAAFRFSQAYSGVTYIAVHQPQGFLDEWNYTCFKPFNTRVTWGAQECKVTIIRHIQQLDITQEGKGTKTKIRYALPIPNREELQLWDDNLKKWSQLIPTLYNAISEETFHTDNLARKLAKHNKPSNEGGPIELSDGDEYVQDSSFQDAEPASSASQLTQQMPSARFGETGPVHWPLLLTLTDSNWLPDTIMFAYLNLLKDQFPTIMFLDLTSSVKRKAFRSRKVVVGYMNLKACHWIAAKLDMTQNLATIEDSLYATFQHEHGAVFEKLQQLANKAGHRQELQRFTVDVPDQRNTNDCGVFACLFQLYMAQSVITRNTTLKYDTKPTARIMRKRIFTDLLAGKITPLSIKDEQ